MNDWQSLLRFFRYELPDSLIPRFPLHPPEDARLMMVSRKDGNLRHLKFGDFAEQLSPGDLLVTNDSRVEKRRVLLRRAGGGETEAVFLESDQTGTIWDVLLKKSGRMKEGEILHCRHIEDADDIFFTVNRTGENLKLVSSRPIRGEDFTKIGEMPIPPYFKRRAQPSDDRDYQNIFGTSSGSAAAPTAALHFSPGMISRILERGILMRSVTLHIGYGTFSPLSEKNFRENRLHPETYSIPPELSTLLKIREHRTICVGTTALRALESAHRLSSGNYETGLRGKTDLFLHPPEKILSADALLTNFHLPESSLLLLVSCMAEPEIIMNAYREAVREKYRFFSYGDAMLLI